MNSPSVPTPRFFEKPPEPGQEIIILLATQGMRDGPASPLVKLVREFSPFWLSCDPRPIVCAVEGSFRAIKRSGLLHDYPDFRCLPPGFRGGIVYVNDIVISYKLDNPDDIGVEDQYPVRVFYLIDPSDPTSIYPESVALKRDCAVAGKTFLATHYGSAEWLTIQWYAERAVAREHKIHRRCLMPKEIEEMQKKIRQPPRGKPNIALVAHDKKKADLLEFSSNHFQYLRNEYEVRFATGTTGDLLNGEEPKRPVEDKRLEELREKMHEKLYQEDSKNWVKPQNSGPKGGDAQLARRLLDRECRRIIFFEDPHVAREHEADIQLLERTSRVPHLRVLCLHDRRSAETWAERWEKCIRDKDVRKPMTLVEAYRRLFKVELILSERGQEFRSHREGSWKGILRTAAYYVLGLIAAKCHQKQKRLEGDRVRVGLTWGIAMCELVEEFESVLHELEDADRHTESQLKRTHASLTEWSDIVMELSTKLTEKLAGPRFARPGNVLGVPLIGIMGATDPRVEANENVRRLIRFVGGKEKLLPEFAFVQKVPGGEVSGKLRKDWEKLDILVLTCDKVKPKFGSKAVAEMPEELWTKVQEASGELGGMFLAADGKPWEEEAGLGKFLRNGISPSDIRGVRNRGGSILIAGAETRRLDPAIAALRGEFASTFVTDPEFAWDLLHRYIDWSPPSTDN